MNIPHIVDSISERLAGKTKGFIQTKFGKIFLSLVLVGPLTFLPTVYTAWTAANIDSLRTPTWPLMIIVNTSALIGVAHNGDWRMRMVMIFWVVIMVALFLATIVR